MAPKSTMREADGDDVEKEPMLEWQVTTKPRWLQYRRIVTIILSVLIASIAGFTLLYHGLAGPQSSIVPSGPTKLAGEVNGLVPECGSTPLRSSVRILM